MITGRIKITRYHIDLLKRMNITYNDGCEFGAPEVNPKRPYGNSYVYGDIGEIIGIEPSAGDIEDPEFTEEQERIMLKFHKETEHALQILVQNLGIEEGIYEKNMYGPWRKVK